MPFATAVSMIADSNTDGTIVERKEVKAPYELHYTSKVHFSDTKELNSDGS